MKRRTFLGQAAGSALALGSMSARAANERPLTIVVPFPAGGPADAYGRALGQALAERTKQTVVVDNRAGAGGALGVQTVVRARPDSNTIGLVGTGVSVFLPLLTDKVLVDVLKEGTLLTSLVRTPMFMVVGPHVKAATVQDLIAEAKAAPGKLTYASAGPGSTPHVVGELFKQKAGVDLLHVPYKGAAPAVQDMLGGQVDAFFGEASAVIPMVKAGKLRALFVTQPERARWLPDVPSAKESGLPEVLGEGSYGLVAPAGMPAAAARELTVALNEALRSPDVVAKYDALMGVPEPTTGEQFTAYVKNERSRWQPVVRKANIRLD